MERRTKEGIANEKLYPGIFGYNEWNTRTKGGDIEMTATPRPVMVFSVSVGDPARTKTPLPLSSSSLRAMIASEPVMTMPDVLPMSRLSSMLGSAPCFTSMPVALSLMALERMVGAMPGARKRPTLMPALLAPLIRLTSMSGAPVVKMAIEACPGSVNILPRTGRRRNRTGLPGPELPGQREGGGADGHHGDADRPGCRVEHERVLPLPGWQRTSPDCDDVSVQSWYCKGMLPMERTA